jgi:hypothetical protein
MDMRGGERKRSTAGGRRTACDHAALFQSMTMAHAAQLRAATGTVTRPAAEVLIS